MENLNNIILDQASGSTIVMVMLTFTVTDTGIGVPKDKQKEIFERFCKLDQFKQGVGLGLDMCRIIAAKLGGEIDIDPDYTDGARFWFAIPV